ncbi:Uncharacterised protein [Mycobacteroides abscessus subsp. abscessus]|nr:Uncharacterised protein [Mycobacteroides abscessus subsp. abscessus]
MNPDDSGNWRFSIASCSTNCDSLPTCPYNMPKCA